MKKYFFYGFICIFVAGFFIFSLNGVMSNGNKSCKIYFVDKKLHRLIPTEFECAKTPEKSAQKVIGQIICGWDKNPEILRIFPNDNSLISVSVSKNTATVNLSGKLSDYIIKNKEEETLAVYQLVNSLTSIDGIDYVQFTIDGERKKKFVGFLDMREIFKPDYDI